MPKDKLTAKQESFCQYYTDSSNKDTFGNGTESARQALYKGNDGTLQSIGSENLLKPVVIAELARIKAENSERVEHTREISLHRLDIAYELAMKQGNTSSMIAAEREKNAISGLHTQTITTAAPLPMLTDTERTELERAAVRLTSIRIHPTSAQDDPQSTNAQEQA